MSTRSALALLVVFACGDKDGGGGPTDADKDGFRSDVDCDDDDPAVNPDAVEVCDGGIDNDCDGRADGRWAADALEYYIDLDGDGFGDPLYPRPDCVAPEGHVDNPDDCDDSDPDTNPSAEEVCNERDDDCDGDIDEAGGATTTWYRDVDEDGYGDASDTAFGCEAPSGYVGNDDDCDDTDGGINPGAAESWYDGIDGDCDGASDYDQDGDGYEAELAGGEDCDDTDPSVRPGVTEHCDGIDEDCDGEVDEDPIVAPTWFRDSDGDGQGVAADRERECEAPSGYVDNATDCDDTDPAVYVGAPEVWYDGIDQDCGGDDDYDQDADGYASDDWGGADCDDTDASVFPTVFYADSDGDGYGDATETLASCETPSGYTLDDTDCDDSTALANPGEAEVCGDGLDNDCDGGATGCGLMGASRVGTAGVAGAEDARLLGPAANEQWGESVHVLGDIDGDGTHDLAVGSTTINAGGGGVYVVSGVPSGSSTLNATTWTSLTGSSGDTLSQSLGGVPDLHGDGYDDLFASAPGAGGTGEAYLLSGPLTSSGALATLADATIVSSSSSWAIGSGFDFGDLTGDGTPDAIVGNAQGSVFIEAGPLSGTVTAGDSGGEVQGLSAATSALVHAAGDLDQDGVDDLFISDSSAGTGGSFYVLFGPITGALDVADADGTWTGGSSTAVQSAAGGRDLNGDGYDDLLVGTPGYAGCGTSCGAAFVLHGPATRGGTLIGGDAAITGTTGDSVGSGVALGDTDGDGDVEAIVGAEGGGAGGQVWLFTGPVTGTISSSAATGVISGAASADDFGDSVSAGDLDSDGYDDLVVGAPRYNGAAINSGGAFILLGGPGL